MVRLELVLAAVCVLSGCVSTGSVERNAEYNVDFRNVSDRSVGLILLRVRGGERDRVRVDLGPRGRYSQTFTQWDQSVAEARLTLEPDAAAGQAVVVDLSPGKTVLEVDVQEGRVVVKPPKVPDSKDAPGP
jgi:hypothetical protein